ncbi:MAG: type II toxin-antitoxin system MqsA family antitoxin [Chloroflexota bacterium]|nr:type II toxin-antitoxin system MqsA family antitoxin [Chloroflexota bacterium]
MIGELENERCYFCGGRLEPNVVTVPFTVGAGVVVVKHVPAHSCTQCGEPVLDSEIAVVIDKVLKQAHAVGFEVSVVAYEQVSPTPVHAGV